MPAALVTKRLALVAALWLQAGALVCSAESAELNSRSVPFNIPSQKLGNALVEFSRQSGVALLVSSRLNLSQNSVELVGDMASLPALEILLSQSRLTFQIVAGGGVVIVPIEDTEPSNLPESGIPPVTREIPLLEEVQVTASKRITPLQDTAMAITAFNQPVLDDLRLHSIFEFYSHVPNLQVARNGDHTASMLYMRGVGSDNHTEAGDSGVVTHVNGVYSSRSQGAALMLYDLERIEVLRGPQGTLFGRNSTGGVINYHTARPVDDLESEFGVTLGDNHRRKFEAMINFPVNDRWALRLAGASDESEGLVAFAPGSSSVRRSDRYNDTDLMSYRLSSDWQMLDMLNWWFSYERFEDRGAGSIPVVDYDTEVLIDTLGATELQIDSYRSRVDWQTGNGIDISYIAGYSRMNRHQDWDGDRTGAPGSEINPLEYHQSHRTVWSDHYSRQHELQIKNSDTDSVRWLLAYFDFVEESGIRFDLEHQNSDGSGWGGAPAHSFQQPARGSRFSAVYGQLEVDLSDLWSVSIGARSGRDYRYDEGGRNIACPDLIRSDRDGVLGSIAVNRESALPGQCFVSNYNDVSQSWKSTTYMARVEYRPSPAVLAYLLYAEGFKPGIVEDGSPVIGHFSGGDDPAFQRALAEVIAINNGNDEQARAYVEPETSRNLELGFKLRLLDGAMTLNGALFRTGYSDLQVSGVVVDADGTQIVRSTNAAAATIRGLELELNWALGGYGRLSGFLSLLDARYDHFLSVDNDFPRYGQTWNPSAGDDEIPDLLDFSGNHLKQAPRSSLSMSYSKSLTLGSYWRVTPRLSAHYKADVYFDEANRGDRSGRLLDNREGEWIEDPNGAAANIDRQPAYWLWDGSLKIEPLTGNWDVELYIRNMTDKLVRYDVQTPEIAMPEYYIAPPRTFGVRLSARIN